MIANSFICLLLFRSAEAVPAVLPLMTSAAALVILGIQCPRDQGVRSGRRRTTAAVRTGDDLQQVAVRILEVEPAAIIPAVDLVALVTTGVGPVREPPFTNALEDLIEFDLAHQKRRSAGT